MATIQVRDVPDETYESLRRQAAEAGQSLQQFMRDQLIDLVESRDAKEDAVRRLEAYLDSEGGVGATAEEIVADVHTDRR